MNFPLIKKIKLYWLSILLSILLLYSLFIQNFMLSDFTKAKQAVSRWPMLCKPHLLMAQAFFYDGSELAIKELNLAKKSWLKNKKLIKQTENLVYQPEKIKQEISFWQEKINQGVQNPKVYLQLALLSYQIWDDQKAQEFWQKANYLDPNNKIIKEVGEKLNACN